MKSIILKTLFLFSVLLFAVPVSAQGMMGSSLFSTKLLEDPALKQEEALGGSIFQKLQKKELTCSTLSEDEFELLGEYFMGQMMGDAHASMNARLKTSLGDEGEIQTHITLGKRASGCEPTAAYSSAYVGFMPMMGSMFQNGYGWETTNTYKFPMMQRWNSWQFSGIWPGWFVVMAFLMLWTIPWKAVALWKAAQKKDLYWFIALLLINTMGILEMLYIFVFSKMIWKKK